MKMMCAEERARESPEEYKARLVLTFITVLSFFYLPSVCVCVCVRVIERK